MYVYVWCHSKSGQSLNSTGTFVLTQFQKPHPFLTVFYAIFPSRAFCNKQYIVSAFIETYQLWVDSGVKQWCVYVCDVELLHYPCGSCVEIVTILCYLVVSGFDKQSTVHRRDSHKEPCVARRRLDRRDRTSLAQTGLFVRKHSH